MCSADGAVFCLPPHYEVEHGAEVSIDRVAVPAGLGLLPSISHSQEVLSQRLRRVRYFVTNRLFQSRRSQPKIRVHSFEICHCSNQSNWTEFQSGRLSHYGKSSNSSRASRSASASIVKNRGLAFQAILPFASRYRMASPRSWYCRRICATSCRLVRLM